MTIQEKVGYFFRKSYWGIRSSLPHKDGESLILRLYHRTCLCQEGSWEPHLEHDFERAPLFFKEKEVGYETHFLGLDEYVQTITLRGEVKK